MSSKIRLLVILLTLATLVLVILHVQPPQTLTIDSSPKLLAFFLPLFILIAFATDFYFKYIFKSLILGIGVISILILQSSGKLNPIAFLLIILILYFLLRVIRKTQSARFDKIPKLSRLKRQK